WGTPRSDRDHDTLRRRRGRFHIVQFRSALEFLRLRECFAACHCDRLSPRAGALHKAVYLRPHRVSAALRYAAVLPAHLHIASARDLLFPAVSYFAWRFLLDVYREAVDIVKCFANG